MRTVKSAEHSSITPKAIAFVQVEDTDLHLQTPTFQTAEVSMLSFLLLVKHTAEVSTLSCLLLVEQSACLMNVGVPRSAVQIKSKRSFGIQLAINS